MTDQSNISLDLDGISKQHEINKDSNTKLRKWIVEKYGILQYSKALTLQEKLREEVIEGNHQYLMLLQHNDVITLGRRTDVAHLLLSEEELKKKSIELFRVDRGGSATYHGPGQLIGYVITKSSRFGGIHNLVSKILQIINKVIQSLSIDSRIDYENPGIWTNTTPPRKLSAVGMSNKHGYTMHGFAVNVDLPLTGFTTIVPCGLALPVSTLAIETGNRYTVSEIADLIEKEFLKILS
ncbi:MAG: lipoyl(octanoyl) transferase LipB [Candidatus Heimdallarchaeota archaeon]|nr:lipoyl(octanoyl) transferase LipB [Candidatus Heimdallarchaeota archaeon]